MTAALLALGLLAVPAASASAQTAEHGAFVQTNDPAGNHVLAYQRSGDGALRLVHRYDTGGKGQQIEGSAADTLASQGSLVYDPRHSLLIGVNAGGNSVYAFQVDGDHLSNRFVIGSGGMEPVSVAVSDDLVYVLNAGGTGSVAGFRIGDGRLMPIPDSMRSLDLQPASGSTAFLNTPGQVGFSPDGTHLIVTTKANGSHIDVFQVMSRGQLSATPVMNASSTPVPFGFTFDPRGRLVVGEAGTSNVSTYMVMSNGSLTPVGTLSDGQSALCWIARDPGNHTYYVSNTGSGTLGAYRIDAAGSPMLIGTTGVVAMPGGGPIDLAITGGFVYAQLGVSGSVAEFRANADGSLTPIGVAPAKPGNEGLVAF